MSKALDEDAEGHEAFQFNDEPQVVDLGGDEVYALFKNGYIDLLIDFDGNILTRDEKARVMRRFLESKGMKLLDSILDPSPTTP